MPSGGEIWAVCSLLYALVQDAKAVKGDLRPGGMPNPDGGKSGISNKTGPDAGAAISNVKQFGHLKHKRSADEHSRAKGKEIRRTSQVNSCQSQSP